jgi:hypothetical protein
MLTLGFLIAAIVAAGVLWKVLEEAQPHSVREVRITGVDYYHSQGKRFWDNYNPKRDLLFVVSDNRVMHEINPDNYVGTHRQDLSVQYRNGSEIETIALEKFLGPPSCIRVQNKIIINQF